MRTVSANTSTILTAFKQLPLKEKLAVSKQIDREILVLRAKELDKKIAPNNFTMTEILAETKAVRRERKNICS